MIRFDTINGSSNIDQTKDDRFAMHSRLYGY